MSRVFHRLAAASGLALLLFGPAGALAADLPPPPPPPEVRSDWTGPYVGGAIGVTCIETEYVPSIGPDPEINGCGFAGGVLGGWNYQFNDFVVGIEGDYMWGGKTGTNHLDAINYSIDGMATVRGRFGWLSGDTLLYGTAGIGWINGTMRALVGPASLRAHDDDTHTGFVVGGGIEHAFSPSVHGRLEYLYGAFNDRKYNLSVATCATPCVVDYKLNQVHMIRAGVTWNFSGLIW
jgi:outer membrane immunogenic protein